MNRRVLLCIVSLSVVLVTVVFVARPVHAYQTRDRNRIEGVITSVAYGGATTTLAIRREDNTMTTIKIPQYPAAQISLLVEMMNAQNRITYEVSGETATDLFPAAILQRHESR